MADQATETPVQAEPRSTADIINELTKQNASPIPDAALVKESEAEQPQTPAKAGSESGAQESPDPPLSKEQLKLVRQQAQQERGNAERKFAEQLKEQNDSFDAKLNAMADTLKQIVDSHPQDNPDSDALMRNIEAITDGDIADPEQIGKTLDALNKQLTRPQNIDVSSQVKSAIAEQFKPIVDEITQQRQMIESQNQQGEIAQFWQDFAKEPENQGIDGPELFSESLDDAETQGFTGDTARLYAQGLYKGKLDAARAAVASNGKAKTTRRGNVTGTQSLKTQGATTTKADGSALEALPIEFTPEGVVKGMWKPD
jgi:hypothetical protein